MVTSSQLAAHIVYVTFIFWLFANMISLVLVRLRSDADVIARDINTIVDAKFPIVILSYMMLFIILPFAIPYHLINIYKTWNDSE